MAVNILPPEGLEVLRRQWGPGRTAQAKSPPVALTPDGPEPIYYLREVARHPDETVVIWSWPGQWRNDVFQTTLGAIR